MKRFDEYTDITQWLLRSAESDRGIEILFSKNEKKTVTYRELAVRSMRLSGFINNAGVKKQEYILLYCSGLENLLYGFWACAFGGYVAVMMNYSPGEPINEDFVRRYGFAGIITDVELANPEWFGLVVDPARALDWTELDTEENCVCEHDAEELLYVQFSSGSTGEGKAIPIKRRSLYASVSDECRCFGVTDKDVVLNWQPLTHSGGLVIYHLLGVYAGLSQYLIPTEVYMKNPLFWMEAASRYGATITSAIPYAMQHFLRFFNNSNNSGRGFEWDLSALRVIAIGAENVSREFLDRFYGTLMEYGLSRGALVPVYGLTEAVCLLAFSLGADKTYRSVGHTVNYAEKVVPSDGGPSFQEYIFYNLLSEHIEVKITDDGFHTLAENEIGRLWIKGPAVADGYLFGRETVRTEQFRDGWYDTGDIGASVGNGIVIVGRAKEIVVAGGANFECAALENCIDKIDSDGLVQKAFVCNTADKDGIERVVVFAVSDKIDSPGFWERFEEYGRQARGRLFETFGVEAADVAAVDEAPRSGSGKLRRREMSLRYLNGYYDKGAGSTEMKKDVRTEVHAILKQILNTEIADDSLTFQEYGVVSINIIQLVDMCSEAFGIRIKASEVFGYPVIADFIAHIEELIQAKESPAASASLNTSRAFAERNGDIAIVGMSCRFPNGANSPEEYWRLLAEGIDGITEVPADRWDKEKYFSEDKNESGKMYCKNGGFLNIPVSGFDAKFFNISPKEAVEIDPHSRMLLELTYEAFENGGMDITEYNGTKTGVFIGAATGDYSLASVSSGDMDTIDSYSLTGVCTSTVCGRISYTFGFQGTCLTVNTACSSALTALHTAVNAIKAGDVDTAVVGGVSLMLSPAISVAFSKLQAVSPNGHSRSFDADADGYARGEGAGVIIIKRLSDAKKDHDNILGVIKATGANQDGRSNGLTAPNGEAQKALILDTLQRHGLEPDSISYVETHGTGTPLGDPIEVNALIDSYCAGRRCDEPLLIGSVKSNIGHLEAASGMAAIIKVLLSFEHKMIPGNLNFNKPNPQIRWEDAALRVVSSNTEWISHGAPRRAAVDSFGFGGSNSHVILEEYINDSVKDARECAAANYFLKISAKTNGAVRKLASEYIGLLAGTKESELPVLLATANAGRADYSCRAAVTGADKDGLIDGLMKVVNEPDAKAGRVSKAAFLFTGQGSQYRGMAFGLYENNPVFRKYMKECDELFFPYLLTSICGLVYGGDTDDEKINDTAYAQPLIFSVEYALAKTWIEYGVTPGLVIGHSIGEFAAAVIAGCMSLETAVELVACRGRLMGAVREDGAMAAVFAEKSVVEKLLEGTENCVIAVFNSKTNTVVSGAREQVELVLQRAAESGIKSKRLVVSNAFHSPLMKQAAERFALVAGRGQYDEPRLPFISTVYAREFAPGEKPDAEYWCAQIMKPVNFYESVLSVKNPQDYFFLEIGATNTLSMLTDMILENGAQCAASLMRGKDDRAQLGETAARLYKSGFALKWESYLGVEGMGWTRSAGLPNYPFERTRYWKELCYDRKINAELLDTDAHSLLGQRFDPVSEEDTVVFRRLYHSDKPFFMGEHIIFDTAIAPAASYVSLIISVMKEIRSPQSITIQNMELREPLIVNDGEEREVQVCVRRAYERECSFMIASRDAGAKRAPWTVHTKGGVIVKDAEYIDCEERNVRDWDALDYDEVSSPDKEHQVYKAMETASFALGTGFRCVTKSRCKDGRGVCVVEPKKNLGYTEEYLIYPGIVDSVFHSMLCVSIADGFSFEGKKTVIPYFITHFGFNYRSFETLWCDSYARIENNSMMGGTKAYNSRGELVIVIDQMMTKLTTEENLITNRRANRSWYYGEDWRKTDTPVSVECGSNRIYLITEDEDIFDGAAGLWKRSGKEVIAYSPQGFEEEKGGIFDEAASRKEKLRFIWAAGCKDEGYGSVSDAEPLKLLALLAQEVQKRGLQSLCTIRVITVNGCNFENERFNLGQSLLWGFMRGMNMEMPESFAGIIDFDKTSLKDGGMRFASLMLAALEPELCVRGGETYYSRVGRISSAADNKDTAIEVSGDKTYVIAGGTGALGFHYMRALQKAGARSFAVICRKEPAASVTDNFRLLEEDGATVGLFFGDICDREQTSELIARITKEMPAVGGVVNAAGTIRDKMIKDLTWEDYLAVLDPKVCGSINLYEETKELKPDFYLFLSSITSILGNMGQSNYAAANYFENIFASYIGAQGFNGHTICWGPWLGDGMAETDIIRRNMETMGISGFAPKQALLALEEFLTKPYKNLMVADIDWDRFADGARNTALRSRLSDLVKKAAPAESRKSDWDISGMTNDEARLKLKDELRLICMGAMGYDGAEGIETDVSLMELGADSLMMFSVRSEINDLLNIDMNVSVLYTYDTIDKLADYLFDEYLSGGEENKAESAGDLAKAAPRKPKILFFPYAGGSVYNFAKWKNRLSQYFEVILIEYPGRGIKAQELFAESIEELVSSVIAELKDTLKDGDYYLFGHSLGAVAAYEFAVQMKRLGLPAPKKAFLSGREPIRFCKVSANTDSMSDMEFIEIMSRYGGIPKEFYQEKEIREVFLPVLRADFRLLERYLYGEHEEKVDCDLVIMYGEDDRNTPKNEMERWREYTDREVSFYQFEGTHFYCMEDENTDRILELICSLCNAERNLT